MSRGRSGLFLIWLCGTYDQVGYTGSSYDSISIRRWKRVVIREGESGGEGCLNFISRADFLGLVDTNRNV